MKLIILLCVEHHGSNIDSSESLFLCAVIGETDVKGLITEKRAQNENYVRTNPMLMLPLQCQISFIPFINCLFLYSYIHNMAFQFLTGLCNFDFLLNIFAA